MNNTPNSVRPHIVLVGKRNAGKSSLINSITEQEIAIVSDTAGTTTDPVSKAMELLPFGPVVFVDTAGIDDVGSLGNKRILKTQDRITGADIILYVCRPNDDLSNYVKSHVAVITHIDEFSDDEILKQAEALTKLGIKEIIQVSNKTQKNIPELKDILVKYLESNRQSESSLLQSLVSQYQLVMLICPIDSEAPKGRLILPQVQTIRDILDRDAVAVVVKEKEVSGALNMLSRKPDLVITDSQVVLKADGLISDDIPLTTFSTLFSSWKGDLPTYIDGVNTIETLKSGDKILIAESCTHKTLCDDIARVKIPRWLRQYTGLDLEIDVVGGSYPANIADYKLIIHCGGCMITGKRMMSRTEEAIKLGIPITNYGIAISYLQGVLDRVIEPFKEL